MKIIAITQKGIHKTENEDRIIVGEAVLTGGTLSCEMESGILAVADGVGGNKAGSVASGYVADRLSALPDITAEALQEINAELLALSMEKAEYNGMASTLSGILFSEGKNRLFSVGNTRVYLLQSGRYLKQLTVDDTVLNYLLTSGQLDPEEAESYDRKNEITACFGGGAADLFQMKISDMDAVTVPILITSDGIHDYISVDQMEEIIGEHGLTETACKEMISQARASGSCDDSSIIIGFGQYG